MQRSLAFAILSTAALAGSATAADFGRSPPPPPPYAAYVPAYPVEYVAVPQVSYYCMRWTERCDRRWGLGSPRFARCMWRHGC